MQKNALFPVLYVTSLRKYPSWGASVFVAAPHESAMHMQVLLVGRYSIFPRTTLEGNEKKKKGPFPLTYCYATAPQSDKKGSFGFREKGGERDPVMFAFLSITSKVPNIR